MRYQEVLIKDKPLAHYVLCVWKIEGSEREVSFRHIPKCQSMLIFSKGSGIRLYNGNQTLSLKNNFILPIFNASSTVELESVNLIGVSFLKDGLFRLIKRDISGIGHQVSNELKVKMDNLRASIFKDSLQKVSGNIQEFLSEEMTLDVDPTGLDRAIELIESSNGCLSIKQICRDAAISERSLQRHFRQRIGISPKTFSKITRVNAYLDELLAEKGSDWMQTVVSFNYHDQPHLINEFKSIIRLSPRDLLKYRDSLYHQLA